LNVALNSTIYNAFYGIYQAPIDIIKIGTLSQLKHADVATSKVAFNIVGP
jgi:hypothetical protein